MFSTPEFWKDKSAFNWRSLLLMPFACLYGIGRKIDVALKTPQSADVPIICIGNLTAGGTGKTPTALAILKLVKKEKLAKSPYFLTRGYGGKIKAPTLVHKKNHCAADVGDEAVLLAAAGKTVVSADRYEGAKLARALGADLIIMDDGFQNNTLHKDLNLIVIDGGYGLGNARLLPAGPLREPLHEGTRRADGFVIIGEDVHKTRQTLPAHKPIYQASITAKTTKLDKEKRYLAFAGLGRPRKFRRTLESEKFNLVGWREFPDHYPYTNIDLGNLKTAAAALNASLITTEKDIVRLQALGVDISEIDALPITLKFESPKDTAQLLRTIS